MSKPIRTGQSNELADSFLDFSMGICQGRSALGSAIHHLHRANNVVFDERKSLGCRKGYRDITDFALPYAGHSLAKFYVSGGTNKAFVGAGAHVYSVVESTGYSDQSLPFSISSNWWHPVNINSALVMTQEGGSNPPMAYNGTAWLSLVYPTPDSTTMTIAPAAGGSLPITGGPAAPATITYRVRSLFANGASLVSGTKTVSIINGSGNYTAAISTIPISARSDYIGFQIERQKQGDTSTWYYVGAVINAATTTYNDAASDASLGTIIPAQPGPYGQAPHFDNIFAYRGRIFGISGTTLYPSQAVADTEAPGVGCFNFNATRSFPVTEFDDGDAAVAWAPQSDRVVIAKGKSGHALAGFDFNTFYMTPLWHGMGAAGSRAMCSHGNTVFFYDTGGQLFRLDGANSVTPWGKNTRRDAGIAPDVTEYLSEVNPSAEAGVVLANYLGRKILVCYPSTPSTYNNEVLAFRISDGTWEHYTNMRIADTLVQSRNTDFAGAKMIFADPYNFPPSQTQNFATTGFAYAVCFADSTGATTYVSPYVQKCSNLGVPQWGSTGKLAKAAASNNVQLQAAVCYDTTTDGCVVAASGDFGGGASDKDIYLQRYDGAGVSQWGTGVKVSTSTASDISPALHVDASGNTFCAFRHGDGFARIQKYTAAAGAEAWTAGGVVLGSGITIQIVNMIPDGTGAFYVAWLLANNLYATRITSAGAAAAGFSVNGTFSGTHLGAMNPSTIARLPMSLGSDGSLLLSRNSSGVTYTIKITSAGVVTTGSFNSGTVADYWIAGDTSGGGYVSFQDAATGLTLKLYAFDSSMLARWAGPLLVHNYGANSGTRHKIVKDGAGGVNVVAYSHSIASWIAYRCDYGGALLWGAGTRLTTLVPRLSGLTDVALSTDGAGGIDCYFGCNAIVSSVMKIQRVSSDGSLQFGIDGATVFTELSFGSLYPIQCSFTGAAQGEHTASGSGGYHLWSAFDGLTDAAPRSSVVAGSDIEWNAELPEFDSGEPDVVKEIQAIELHTKKGVGTVNVSITMDATGRSTAIPVPVSIAGALWGGGANSGPKTLYWGPATGAHPTQPHNWGGDTSGVVRTGVPGGLLGRKYTITLSASVDDELILGGAVVDYVRRPDRTFARTF